MAITNNCQRAQRQLNARVCASGATGYLSFGPMVQCVVHALKCLACRARVTPASSPVSLTLPSLHARGRASPSRARQGHRKHNIFNGSKTKGAGGTQMKHMGYMCLPRMKARSRWRVLAYNISTKQHGSIENQIQQAGRSYRLSKHLRNRDNLIGSAPTDACDAKSSTTSKRSSFKW